VSALPSWLDPAAEVTQLPAPPAFPDRAAERARAAAFIAEVVAACRAAGAPLWQAFEVAAIACLEATWGRARTCFDPLFNLGGSKAKKEIALRYKAEHGRPQRWFRAPGHVASGDAPVVVYLCWDSIPEYCSFWLARHVGRDAHTPPWESRYLQAAALFWGRFPDWIDALLVAGYRGERTAADPAASIAGHHTIVGEVRAYWAQGRLGVHCDGDWGPRSRAALAVIQHAHGLPETGDLDDASLALLETR